jgi:hypothetical protein
MTCLGTNLCESAPTMVTLIDGCVVCSSCPEYRNEREAERLLDMPLRQRREELEWREQHRPAESVERLKAAMAAIYERRRA